MFCVLEYAVRGLERANDRHRFRERQAAHRHYLDVRNRPRPETWEERERRERWTAAYAKDHPAERRHG